MHWRSFSYFPCILSIFLGLSQAVKLLDCKDRVTKLCLKRLDVRKKEYCFQDWTFARFQCCATCAQQLYGAEIDPSTGIAKDPTDPKKKEEFYKRIKNPQLPCKDSVAPDLTPRTEWCRRHILPLHESKPGSCARSVVAQTWCLAACRYEECNPPPRPPPSGGNQGQTSGPTESKQTDSPTITEVSGGGQTTKAPSSDPNLPLISP